MLTELVFETVSSLLKLFFQDFLFAIVQGYGGLVLNQDTGPEKRFNYLIFWEARTGPHKSVCLYKTGPGVSINA